MRKHSKASGLAPEENLGRASILSPATAVVGWYESVEALPRLVKNERFTISGCGIPEEHLCKKVDLMYL